jgi:hypothetical protein
MAKTQVATVVRAAPNVKTVTLIRKDGATPTVDAAEVAKNPNAALPPAGNAEFVKDQ